MSEKTPHGFDKKVKSEGSKWPTPSWLMGILVLLLILASFIVIQLLARDGFERSLSTWVHNNPHEVEGNAKRIFLTKQNIVLNRANDCVESAERIMSFVSIGLVFISFMIAIATAIGFREYLLTRDTRERVEKEHAELKETIKRDHQLIQVKSLIFQKDYEKSLQILTKIRPDNPEVLFLRGAISRRKGNHSAALEYFDQALEAGYQDKATLYFEKGVCFKVEGDWESALDEFEKCLNEQPDIEGLINKAYCMKRIDPPDYPKMIKLLTTAIELDPNKGLGHYNLACYYSRMEEYDKVKEPLLKAIRFEDKYLWSAWWDEDLRNCRAFDWFKETVMPQNCEILNPASDS